MRGRDKDNVRLHDERRLRVEHDIHRRHANLAKIMLPDVLIQQCGQVRHHGLMSVPR